MMKHHRFDNRLARVFRFFPLGRIELLSEGAGLASDGIHYRAQISPANFNDHEAENEILGFAPVF